uniref:Uncharacterized protein n=1 Tax=viral metagenome TaxID=1070528 RepID=A0A6C0E1N7_9ZZZZ
MKKYRSSRGKHKYNKRGGNTSYGTSTDTPNTINTTIPSSPNSTSGFMSWMTNAWNSTKKNSQGLFSKLSESTSNMMNKAKTSLDGATSSTPVSNNTPVNPNVSTSTTTMQGGKTRRKKGGYNIAYNAAPVYRSNVAAPTYWIGGKTRRRLSKKLRKHKK